jgi:hypothetical protein
MAKRPSLGVTQEPREALTRQSRRDQVILCECGQPHPTLLRETGHPVAQDADDSLTS